MAILGRAQAPAESTAPPQCNACKVVGEPLQTITQDVRICVAAAPCIARAKTAGIWKQS